jgi:glycosyltransferase involved in cell wall biosynthesis
VTGSRRLVASSRRFDAYERLDLLVHALAQLADPVTLEIIGDTSRSGKLRQLTRAYGIEDRATFSSGSPDPDAEPVFSSAANLAAAPIRPRPGTSPLVLDPSATIAGPRVVRNMAEFVEELTRDDDAPGSTHVVDAALESCRAVIVSNVPAAYRIELFERVAARLAAAGGSLDVVFLAASASGRPWIGDSDVGFRHHFLRSFELPRGERRPLVPLDLERRHGSTRRS